VVDGICEKRVKHTEERYGRKQPYGGRGNLVGDMATRGGKEKAGEKRGPVQRALKRKGDAPSL